MTNWRTRKKLIGSSRSLSPSSTKTNLNLIRVWNKWTTTSRLWILRTILKRTTSGSLNSLWYCCHKPSLSMIRVVCQHLALWAKITRKLTLFSSLFSSSTWTWTSLLSNSQIKSQEGHKRSRRYRRRFSKRLGGWTYCSKRILTWKERSCSRGKGTLTSTTNTRISDTNLWRIQQRRTVVL